jgi:hypothetical protein
MEPPCFLLVFCCPAIFTASSYSPFMTCLLSSSVLTTKVSTKVKEFWIKSYGCTKSFKGCPKLFHLARYFTPQKHQLWQKGQQQHLWQAPPGEPYDSVTHLLPTHQQPSCPPPQGLGHSNEEATLPPGQAQQTGW